MFSIRSVMVVVLMSIVLEASAETHLTGVKELSAEEIAHMVQTAPQRVPEPTKVIDKIGDKVRGFRQLNKTTRLPDSFDWRQETKCRSLFDIRKQLCSNCWAVAAADVLSDRYCLFTGKTKIFSHTQATMCSYAAPNVGCNGGWPHDFYANMFNKTGITTGGDPYVVPKQDVGCLATDDAFYRQNKNNPGQCPAKCDNGGPIELTTGFYQTLWNKDDAQYYSSIYPNQPQYVYGGSLTTEQRTTEMMWQIYQYGPIAGNLYVDQKFMDLKANSPVWEGTPSGSGHIVRMIGWGTEKGIPYWLVANQWGREWGNNGYGKVRRGNTVWGFEGKRASWPFPREAYY